MRVPISWLSRYCDPGWEPDVLAERLAMTGTEVERVAIAGAPDAEGYVLGSVRSVEAHPDADRLRVCQVDTGEVVRTIVCGAPNVAAGQFVPVALPGAVLPDGTRLAKAKLRGVVSDGMILSEAELGISDEGAGIAVLGDADGLSGAARAGDGATAGTPLIEVLPVSEAVLELEVTPNRPDCLGVYGVAREVHAISAAPLAPAPWSEDAVAAASGSVEALASVTVEVPGLCPRFTARAFEGVTVAPSPLWLKAWLSAAGQRPINNVVDITNYVMLLTAQPLHAFDLDLVPAGELTIRAAVDGETMTTLDGVERTLDSEAVLVCDREGPSGIAGIMGGRRSEVSPNTTRVLLEVATWNGVNILRTSRALGLRSEASARFEKQLHPDLAIRAQRIASRLLVELCGAKLVPGTIDVRAGEPAPRVVTMRVARVAAVVGLEIDEATCVERLGRLGFGVEVSDGVIRATVPPDRDGDVQREADLIEEVARLADLDTHLVGTLPAVAGRVGGLSRSQRLRRRAEDILGDLGFDEIVAWSFADRELADRLRLDQADPRRACVELANPLSAEQAVMRTTLLGGLLDAARLNLARGAERVALFESARVYLSGGDPSPGNSTPADSTPADSFGGELAGSFPGDRLTPAHEPHRLGALICGEPSPSFRTAGPPPDFFSLKGSLEALCGQLRAELEVGAAGEPFLAPGRGAVVIVGGRAAGWIGELHPMVAGAWDLPAASAFELDLSALVDASEAGVEIYSEVTAYPALREDVAVVVPEEVPAERVRRTVIEAGGELLREARVFDLYRGEQLEPGSKSLALRLSFRSADRTLTDDEIAMLRMRIEASLEAIGGSLRE